MIAAACNASHERQQLGDRRGGNQQSGAGNVARQSAVTSTRCGQRDARAGSGDSPARQCNRARCSGRARVQGDERRALLRVARWTASAVPHAPPRALQRWRIIAGSAESRPLALEPEHLRKPHEARWPSRWRTLTQPGIAVADGDAAVSASSSSTFCSARNTSGAPSSASRARRRPARARRASACRSATSLRSSRSCPPRRGPWSSLRRATSDLDGNVAPVDEQRLRACADGAS